MLAIFSLTYFLELLEVCMTGYIYNVSIPHRSIRILTVQQIKK